MSLVTMKELLTRAEKSNIAVGAFNVGNMEMLLGAIKAAEEENTSIIIQIAECRLAHSPLYVMAPMMVEAAKKSKVDVAVQFDHGKTGEAITEALNYGFTSIMYDGSQCRLEDNIENTNRFTQLAGRYKASIEAELGILGGNEGCGASESIIYTNPSDAIRFANETNVDALAVAIGNAHGNYKEAPKLQFDILKEIHEGVSVPLVLHGGTGISPEDFDRCIENGIRKINVATANFDATVNGAMLHLRSDEPHSYFGLNEAMVDSVRQNVKRHIKIFNREGVE